MEAFVIALDQSPPCDYVVGPGRSGAVAAVYASHYLGVPMLPWGCKLKGKIPLVVDTTISSGRTIRKASRKYDDANVCYAFEKGDCRLRFWYERLSLTRGKGNEYKTEIPSQSPAEKR